ncbi:MAG: peptidoglycan DD-metalloendopeptidase family protein [Clostridia bacterium]|nr:peptidoglycan DD-metalloendopeptidase family protein [Clostridia bacterium]
MSVEILDFLYNQIYFIGVQTLRYGKRFFRWLVALLLKPVKAIGTLIFTLFIVIDKHALGTFHKSLDELKALFRDAKSVSKKSNEDKKEKKSIGSFVHYIGVALRRYKGAFVYVLNFALPAFSFVFLLNVVGFWNDAAFALEINYNDEVIGYVQDEAVYKEAREMAYERLDINTASVTVSKEDEEEFKLIDDAEYNIKLVKRGQINDASEICDNLIEKSDNKITNACGVYVDDKFICAVKNETDALSVFDSILAEHETGEENVVVSFVENIDYVQGLYLDSDSIIKDAEYLQNKLNSNITEDKYYTVQDGDTILGIVQKCGISTAQLYKLNPELSEIIRAGQKILIAKANDFIHVQTTKTEYKEVEVPYDTITINTSNLYVGDKKTVTKGENGLERITELVTYIGGERFSSKEVSRVTIKEAVSEKIQVGTKKNQTTSSSSSSSKGKLRWPAIGATSVSSPYGKRDFGDGWHAGIDIVRPGGSMGCTVVAAAAGTVTYAGWYNSGGYTVMIDHGNGMTTMYCHMQNTLKVRSGQKVARGQAIGNIGATGYVTGPHLHFEVKINGKNVNPALYL